MKYEIKAETLESIIAKQKELIALLKIEPRFGDQTDKHYTWEESIKKLESELQTLENEAEPKPAKDKKP
jgi:hypothetical protein